MSKVKTVRPTIRFGTNQYKLVKEKLDQLDVTFQEYAVRLICDDLGVPSEEWKLLEKADDQISLFDVIE